MSATRAVLLDLYETLAWTDWPAMRAEMEARLGVPAEALLEAFIGTRPARSLGTYADAEGDVAAVLEAAGVPPEPGLVRSLTARVQEFLTTGVHLYDDALPVLRELRARGVRTAVVSNCDHTTRPVVDRLGLPAEVDSVVLSFELGVAKPDPGIYLAALERVGARPQEALFVDDQAVYCDGATALGMRTALLRREGGDPPGGPGRPGRHPQIRSLRGVLDVLLA